MFAAEQERLCSRTGMIAHLEAISELKKEGGKREEGERVNGRLPAAFPFLPDGPIVKPSDLN